MITKEELKELKEIVKGFQKSLAEQNLIVSTMIEENGRLLDILKSTSELKSD